MAVTTLQVQVTVGVGSRLGYGYFTYRIYIPARRRSDGVWTWRSTGSTPEWFRSDVRGRHRFDDVVETPSVRHRRRVEQIQLTRSTRRRLPTTSSATVVSTQTSTPSKCRTESTVIDFRDVGRRLTRPMSPTRCRAC